MQWTAASNRPVDCTDQFQREGYVLLGRVLTDAGLAEARNQLDRMIANLHPTFKPDEIYSAHQQERWLLELCNAPQLLDAGVVRDHLPNLLREVVDQGSTLAFAGPVGLFDHAVRLLVTCGRLLCDEAGLRLVHHAVPHSDDGLLGVTLQVRLLTP